MSKSKWGDRIPQVRELEVDGRRVERWVVDGRIVGKRGVCNCPAAMNDPLRHTFPQTWDDVPPIVYDPHERLEALDSDGVDAEVLFFNDPIDSATLPFHSDSQFELACVQAYNDALAEWRQASNRFIPLAVIPYLSDIDTATQEVERAVGMGHYGIVMVAEPSMARAGLRHLNDGYWDPLLALCQELDVPIHWHAHAGIKLLPDCWIENQVLRRAAAFSAQPQFLPNLFLSGLADRYPRLRWVCAETGMGWLASLLQICDNVWERHRLWTEGVRTRPTESFQKRVYVHFCYEQLGLLSREATEIDNVLWASDYPHGTSTYPNSWKMIDQNLAGASPQDKRRLLYENASRLYKLPLSAD
jgi:predicted TIM-barrel fold metal-dependent hydrolase